MIKKTPIVISDLLDVVHTTIIKEKGKNDIILDELRSIEKKIDEGKLKNYRIVDNPFWYSILNNAENKTKVETKFDQLIACLCTDEMLEEESWPIEALAMVRAKGKEGYLVAYDAGLGFTMWSKDGEEFELWENEIEIL